MSVIKYLSAILYFLLFVLGVAQSQNMVPNGDFENKRGTRYTTRPWRFINTIDVFEMDDPNKLPVFTKKWEFPKPHSGEVMLGMRVYPNYREFLQIRLTESLEAGKRYYFEMYVYPSKDFNYYVKSIGSSFYHRRPSYTSDYYIYKCPPQIEVKNPKGIKTSTDSTGWIKISGTFRSDGTEKYVTVGNFSFKRRKDRLKKKQWWKFNLHSIAYYFVDDIALYELLDNGEMKEEKLTPLARIDSSFVLPDSLPYTIEEENYIYTIESKKQLVLDNIRFEFGSDKLIFTSYEDLELVLEYLNANPGTRIKITGHTDDVGDDDDNMKLSLKRAKAVYDYFIDNQIDKVRLEFEGKGETKPIASNETSSGKSQNRRVEIELLD
mgnify:CR=1 FL=1